MPPNARTARVTGLLYLGLAVAGALGFLVVRPRLFAADDPGATLANLTEHGSLVRGAVALELLVVLTQALSAVWFQRLFRAKDSFAAGCIAAFGMVNAVAILVSAASIATAAQLARDPVGDAAATVHLLYLVSENLWQTGGLFFGLWLIPMGWCVLRSGWMPRPLGWILVVGGAGYVISAFTAYLLPDATFVTDALAMPATVGELWMIGYLLIVGVRKAARGEPAAHPMPEHATV